MIWFPDDFFFLRPGHLSGGAFAPRRVCGASSLDGGFVPFFGGEAYMLICCRRDSDINGEVGFTTRLGRRGWSRPVWRWGHTLHSLFRTESMTYFITLLCRG